MIFWEHIYELRGKGLIPREWKRDHLRPYLERPQGPFASATIATVPYNQSLTRDGREIGNYIKRRQDPKSWRTGPGVFQLIVDPDDDKKTQDTELARARRLAVSGFPRRTLIHAEKIAV